MASTWMPFSFGGFGQRSLSFYLIDYRGGRKFPVFDFVTPFYLSDPDNSHPSVFISFCLVCSSSVNGKSSPEMSLSFTYWTLPKNCFTYPCLQYHSSHFGKWQICCHLFWNCSVCPSCSPFFLLAANFWILFFDNLSFNVSFKFSWICRALTSEAVLLQRRENCLCFPS